MNVVSSEVLPGRASALLTPLERLIAWSITPVYLVLFFAILVFFHPLLVLSHLVSRQLNAELFKLMNLALLTNLRWVAGARFTIHLETSLPSDRPLILVSNHQSMYDIPLIIWALRTHLPRFVAKRELSRGLPSISFSLRAMGSAIIDRNDPAQAINEIQSLGRRAQEECFAACVFPEGTRSRDGVLRRFKSAGFQALLNAAPDALVVPVAISGSWELLRYNLLPIPYGVPVRLTVLSPIDSSASTPRELVREIERRIREVVG
jgi:1-acyl-sn-glycerol-3-phosphate acyltransferase